MEVNEIELQTTMPCIIVFDVFAVYSLLFLFDTAVLSARSCTPSSERYSLTAMDKVNNK